MMKLGLVSAILPGLTYEEVIDYAAQTGFSCVEICCWPVGKAVRRYAGVTHIDADQVDEEKINYYKNYAQERGIQISSLCYYPNPMDADREAAQIAQEHIKKLIVLSARMGINMVTTFLGKDKTKTVEENLELMPQIWGPILKLAESLSVKVGIENCPMLYTKDEWPGGNNLASTPYVWRKMFQMSPNIGLNYDPSHPYLLGMEINKALYDFPDRIFHVHFKDIRILQDKLNEYGMFSYPALWHIPKLPGLGGVDFSSFISTLNEIDYKGPACIEVEDRAYESSIEDVKYGIEQSYRYLSQFLGA